MAQFPTTAGEKRKISMAQYETENIVIYFRKKNSDTKITDPENKNEFYTARELRRGRGHLPVCRKARDR